MIKDVYGRAFRKLRVSLLDTCNYRCTYCMPENVKFNDENLLSSDEISNLVSALVHYGLEEVRITGGEPCLRKDITEIVHRLSELKIKRLGLTTNGHLLTKYLGSFRGSNLSSINISLDSLKQEKFKMITKVDGLEKVISSIFMAQELGYKVKVNTVMMKGVNDDELLDFVEFAINNKIEVRFLELMKIGVMKNHFNTFFLPAYEMVTRLKENYQLNPLKTELDSTCFKYDIQGVDVGFIASESQPFCNHCSRLRLSSKGQLRSCLMKEHGIDIRKIAPEKLPQILQTLINDKPIERIESIEQAMYQIGG